MTAKREVIKHTKYLKYAKYTEVLQQTTVTLHVQHESLKPHQQGNCVYLSGTLLKSLHTDQSV